MWLKLALASLLNRRLTVLLTVLSIAVSVAVMIAVEHIRAEAKSSFSKTVSGVDLIVGARTGQVNLLLYSVFRIGSATNNISWASYRELAASPAVAWTVPISLGDSHRGYRVMGTSADYFRHFRYGQKQPLAFSQGRAFDGVFEAVIGAEVAAALGYQLDQSIILAHGVGGVSFSKHDDKPFTVVGILEATGTPVDQTVHVSLEGIEAIHIGWQGGVKIPGRSVSAAQALQRDLTPQTITAFMVGLNSRMATFSFQRAVNEYRAEPLLAILPGVALAELWQMMGVAEQVLRLVSVLVLTAALLGMTTMLLASMKERSREMAVLRAAGASPRFIFFLIEAEALLITLAGAAVGVGALSAGLLFSQQWLISHYGLFINVNPLDQTTLLYLLAVFAGAAILSLVPALLAYRNSLAQGLAVRL